MMSFRLIEKDCKTLECIAEYRMLTLSQIAAMFHKKCQEIVSISADIIYLPRR